MYYTSIALPHAWKVNDTGLKFSLLVLGAITEQEIVFHSEGAEWLLIWKQNIRWDLSLCIMSFVFVNQLAVSVLGYSPGRSGSQQYLIFPFGGLMNGPDQRCTVKGQKPEYMISAPQWSLEAQQTQNQPKSLREGLWIKCHSLGGSTGMFPLCKLLELWHSTSQLPSETRARRGM